MSDKRVAIRYAKALLSLAIEQKLEDVVYNDFKMVITTVTNSKELKSVFKSPIIHNWKKKNIFNEIFGTNIHKLTIEFIQLLTAKHRESLVLSIISEYTVIYNVNKNILPIEVISAIELDDKIKANIIAKIEEYTNKKVEPTFDVKPNIKGGFIVKMQDWIFDASIQNQLDILYKSLASGNAA